LNALKITVVSYAEGDIGRDYQTVGVGYKNGDKHNIVNTMEGDKRSVVLYKYYLYDYLFGALIKGDADLVAKCANYLQNPIGVIFFGRKNCLPSAPVYAGCFDQKEEAEERLKNLFEGKKILRGIRDIEEGEYGTDILNDCVLNFATREFTSREVRVVDFS
jgi:CRISPR system Cascade subunit CasD